MFSKVRWYCRSFSCFSFAAVWMWNWTSPGNLIWTWMMWLALVDDVEGSQRVVGREHKRAFQPRKDSSSLDCILDCHQVLNLSFRSWFMFLHYWRQQFIGERTRFLDAGSQSLLVSWENLFNNLNITLLSCWFWDQLSSKLNKRCE